MQEGSKENIWPMLCHLSSLSGYLGNGIGSIVGPLLVWLIKKDTMPEVDAHGKEALNFNVSILIYGIGLTIFTFLTLGFGAFLAVPLVLAMVIFHIVCTVIATIKANNGEFYQYPLTIRLFK
jgi:uncharacterized Tic20 family protein